LDYESGTNSRFVKGCLEPGNGEIIMTGLEAIPKIMGLIGQLIQRVQDGPTLALVQQIQQHQLEIHRDLMEAHAKIAKMEAEQPHALTAIREAHRLETAGLNTQIEHLKAQLAAKQKDGVSPDTITVLKIFFNCQNSMSNVQIGQHLKIQLGVANSHIDELLKRRFITQTRPGDATDGGGSPPFFQISTAGRAYIVKNQVAS